VTNNIFPPPPIIEQGVVPGQDYWPTVPGLPQAAIVANLIWRPGGVARGNVVTTAAAVRDVLNAAQGAVNIFIDPSIAPANVDVDWNGFGCASLYPFNAGAGFVFTILDGSTLHDFAEMQNLTAVCQCATTQAFSFDEFSSFLLLNFASISLAAGALVPAIRITAADQSFALFSLLGALDNSNAPTVPVIATDAGATTTIYPHSAAPNFTFLVTGNEIGGGPGSRVFWENDDTVPPLASALFTGTLVQSPCSDAGNASYEPANLANWSGVAPMSVANALDRIAAKIGPIP
jgi:hypothetical protein